MANYSVTLNFFIPKNIVESLNGVEIRGDYLFDYRKSDFCHCTVKAIAHFEKEPENDILDSWIAEIRKILVLQKSFKAEIRNVEIFPTAVVANVYSEELIALHKKLFKILPSSQIQYENENYIPHVTVGLIGEKVELVSGKGQDFGEFTVNEFQLMIWSNKLENIKKYEIFRLR